MSDESNPRDRVARIQDEWARERPDLDVFPLGVIGRMHRLADFLREDILPVIREFGLNGGEFEVLLALRRAGAPYQRNPTQLADYTMVTSGAMTKRLDRLESAGLVTRRVSDEDGRRRRVALTASGLDLVDRAFEAHLQNEHRMLAVLDEAGARELERLLTTWLRHYEDPG